jgi:pSer/pThr/pTyr-binding forkhead associated (FHA) protein
VDIASADRRVPTNTVGDDLLVCVNGARMLRRAIEGEFIIGRNVPPSHIQIDHPGISRLHVRLLPGARWELVDYDSRNGVYLDGHRIEYETPITDGMTVHLGAYDGIPVTFLYVPAERQPSPTPEAFDLDGEITEIITPAMRRALLIDAAALTLANVDTAIADLPPAADPRFMTEAEPLLNRLAALENSLGTTPAIEDGGGTEMLRTITRVYISLLTLAGASATRDESGSR